MGGGGFLVFWWLLENGYSEHDARNYLLLLFVLFENFQTFNSRSERHSVFRQRDLRQSAACRRRSRGASVACRRDAPAMDARYAWTCAGIDQRLGGAPGDCCVAPDGFGGRQVVGASAAASASWGASCDGRVGTLRSRKKRSQRLPFRHVTKRRAIGYSIPDQHELAKPVIIAVVTLHAVAALWQHFYAKSDVLLRMLRPMPRQM